MWLIFWKQLGDLCRELDKGQWEYDGVICTTATSYQLSCLIATYNGFTEIAECSFDVERPVIRRQAQFIVQCHD